MINMAEPVRQALDRPMPSADAGTARLAAARAAGMAAELRRLQGVLAGLMGRDVGWSGAAELAFQESVSAGLGRFGPAARRFEGYAAALASYARELEQVAPALLAARSRLSAGGEPSTGVGVEPSMGVGVERSTAEFERRWQQWDSARRRCAAGLAAAGELNADPRRHGWSALLSDVSRVVPHEFSLAGLSHALGDLGQALVVAGVVLSLVCPPAAGAVWAAVAVVAVCQLAVDVTRRERGENVGLAGLGLDALGALPVGRFAAQVHSVAEADAAIQRLAPELRSSRLVPGGGLAAHEGTATDRGHTLLKHVGKTPKQLAARFANEPNITWSSSFTDRRTAEAATAEILDHHQLAIAHWLASPRGTLILKSSLGREIGKSMSVGGTIVSASSGLVVLRKENTMLGYYIRTAFPTP